MDMTPKIPLPNTLHANMLFMNQTWCTLWNNQDDLDDFFFSTHALPATATWNTTTKQMSTNYLWSFASESGHSTPTTCTYTASSTFFFFFKAFGFGLSHFKLVSERVLGSNVYTHTLAKEKDVQNGVIFVCSWIQPNTNFCNFANPFAPFRPFCNYSQNQALFKINVSLQSCIWYILQLHDQWRNKFISCGIKLL